ncbi:hypothetical protein [Halosegnis sp.]|uniref:hypothetical protein n=1 Tax=Halosegnis sp. TaxID=2864959 RepID=UPI0035D518FB
MGRTNPTFRDRLDGIERAWSDYRRGLRGADQERFDRLFEAARGHADAAGYLNHTEPLFPVLVSILLAHRRELDRLQARVETLEAAVGHRVDGTDGTQRRLSPATRHTDQSDGPDG